MSYSLLVILTGLCANIAKLLQRRKSGLLDHHKQQVTRLLHLAQRMPLTTKAALLTAMLMNRCTTIRWQHRCFAMQATVLWNLVRGKMHSQCFPKQFVTNQITSKHCYEEQTAIIPCRSDLVLLLILSPTRSMAVCSVQTIGNVRQLPKAKWMLKCKKC